MQLPSHTDELRLPGHDSSSNFVFSSGGVCVWGVGGVRQEQSRSSLVFFHSFPVIEIPIRIKLKPGKQGLIDANEFILLDGFCFYY